MPFEFATANRIVFGPGKLRQAGSIAGEFGVRTMVVTGRNPARAEPLVDLLKKHGIEPHLFSVPGEPRVDTVREGVSLARTHRCEVIIGFGGGSALDAGKAVAAMTPQSADVTDYLEIIGRGKSFSSKPLPFIAIPTTAGTGSEVTRNAVLGSPEHRLKVSLRSPLMLPTVALVDPELTYDLPPAVTASTGIDALTQLIEPFICARTNPITDAICVEGIRRVARSLRRAVSNGCDAAAREDMCIASLFGGMALANAGLGAVHGLAGPIGGRFDAPHGAVCAALLPFAMEINLRALRDRAPASQALERLVTVAQLLTGNNSADAPDAIEWIRKLVSDLNIPSLASYGISTADFPELTRNAANASSMKANPIALTPLEISEILAKATDRAGLS